MENKKGLSPIISVVLMIVIAISIGVTVTIWVTHIVSKYTTSESVTCAIDTNYKLDSVEYTNSSNELLIMLTNKGSQELYDFEIILINGTKILRFNKSNVYQDNINSTNKLGKGDSLYIKVNSTQLSTNGLNLTRPMGRSLTEVRVLNKACPDVWVEVKSITQT